MDANVLVKGIGSRGLSKNNQEEWRITIQSEKNSEKEKHVTSYLKWAMKKRSD